MNQTEVPIQSEYPGERRRKTPRIEVLGHLHGQLVAMDVPIIVRNLGAGGFGIESEVAFPVGATHTFRFTAATGFRIVVSGAARHCQPFTGADGVMRYRAGFEFLFDANGQTARAVEALLEAVTSVLMLQ